MKIVDFHQGSPEWLASRAGKVTASRIKDVMTKIKTGESAARRDYKFQIVTEMLTGLPADAPFVNDAMRWGTETEPLARAAYEMFIGAPVDQCGLVLHPSIERAAASPDGLVAPFSLVEFKCPKTSTHLATLFNGKIPSEYEYQMLWQMACCERGSCDFVSFDPRLPENLQMVVLPFQRDEARIGEIEAEVRQFLAEALEIVEKLQARGQA